MFNAIYLRELYKNLKSPAFYIFTGVIFFGVYTFVTNIKPGVIFMGISYGKEWHNAPIIIAKMFTHLSVFGALVTTIMVGRSVTRDFETKIHDFFFTLPLDKITYLGGRFFGGLTANLVIFIGIIPGFIIGGVVLPAEYQGPFQVSAYLLPILMMLLPNLLVIGSIFFALATLSRKMVLTYIAGVLFMLIYAAAIGGFGNLKNETLRILLDPFGIQALYLLSKFWTVAEINQFSMPLHGILLLNRLIWLALGFSILYYTWRKFKFVSLLEKKKIDNIPIELASAAKIVRNLGPVSFSELDDSLSCQLKKFFHLVFKEFRRIAYHPAFIILSFAAMSEIVTNFVGNLNFGHYSVYPLTSWYLHFTGHIWAYMIPITIFFGGVLVWRERDNQSNEFYDTLPVPDWLGYLAKLATLMSLHVFYLVLAMLTGMITQAVFFGFTDFELALYMKKLFGIEMFKYWHMAIIVLLIQNLVPNKYAGFFLSALYFIADSVIFTVLKLDHILLRYGHVPHYVYSNLNGFGHYAPLIIWYTIYWFLFGLIIIGMTALLWRRNNETHLKFRYRVARQKLNWHYKLSLSTIVILFLLTGGYIAYNRYFLNHYQSENDLKKMQADYERKYGKYETCIQPGIVDTRLKVDIFPVARNLLIKGTYVLKNKSNQNIKEIYLNLNERQITTINQLEFSISATLKFKGDEFGFRIYELSEPLTPGAEVKFAFDLAINKRGFSDNHPMDELAYNGTCILQSPGESVTYFPSFGFNSNLILRDDYERKTHGLPERSDYPTLEHADKTICFVNDNLSTYDAVVSTCQDQVVISNGNLVRKWQEGDRNYFHYKSDLPMINEFVFASGKYQVSAKKYKHITTEVYYDKKHDYNIDRLMKGVEKSLDYCSSNFSPYRFGFVRIVEIPDYLKEGGARSQPTVFIWRENAGFTTDLRNPGKIDHVFGICTHEMAHQWWAYLIRPARAEGAFVLSETMAQYVEIMCLEHEYGEKMTQKYHKEEMERYLRLRQRDRKGERPLMRAFAEQHYLNYPKSTVVMYALQDYIGERAVNLALKRLVKKFADREDLYPTSVDVVTEFRAVTPDSLQYLISDLFEKVTLYENKAVSAQCQQLANGQYQVNLNVVANKFNADSIGNQTKVALNDYIDIGVFAENQEALYLKKHQFTQSEAGIHVIVDKKPFQAGIDPYLLLIDRDRENNMVKVTY